MSTLFFIIGLAVAFAYENIALNKPANEQFPYNLPNTNASNAVDGLKSDLRGLGGECSLSAADKRTATWWVNLTSILSIHHITIYYRTDNVKWDANNGYTERFLGFSVYISNTTDKKDGQLCFKDDRHFNKTTIPAVFNTTCTFHGQYVIYYNERLQNVNYPADYSTYAFNDLCELEVYGCPIPGYYGSTCSVPCPGTHCRYCHIETGSCEGCKPGYQGHNCERECDYEFYGDGCRSMCGHCADLTPCHHVTGVCEGGCQPGYRGDFCDQMCETGTYGIRCNKTCGYCQDGDKCFHTNGTCLTGCAAGYEGDLCNTTCPEGFFGENCIHKCNNSCIGCNSVNGLCETGCTPGWKGIYCHEPCVHVTYGENCSKTCGNCLQHKQCHHVNGTCMDGCDRGFQGSTCTQKCDNNHFGYNCDETCNDTCKGCNSFTGLCEYGCRPGWRGIDCHTECMSMYHGENCTSKCGNCFNNETCHHVNGTCLTGCNPGYQGHLCNEECSGGKYGLYCEEECGNCLDPSHCSHVNGTCLTGCGSGFQGDLCKALVDDPSPAIAIPIVGAVLGILVAAGVIAGVVFILRRWRSNASSRDTYFSSNAAPNESENQYSNVKVAQNSSSKKSEKQAENKGNVAFFPSDYEESNNTSRNHTTDEDNVYMNQTLTQDIPVDQLQSIIADKSANENEKFRKEYAALPSGEIHTCDVGKNTENVQKNRFKTTFPYDHSRVVLRVTNEETSDYINANYIDGLNRTKEYIAAQGPKQITLKDFWRMVWQEEVNTIVMLTNLKEGDKIKCTKYWPDKNETSTYGPLSIRLIEEKKYAFFIERKLSNSNTALNKTRAVTQYHYIAWPDHGTPEPISLLDFHHHVITTANKKTVPTLVHCSAGVGRTGTYIALDALYQEGKNTGKVNVVEFVKKMRENRVSMVQTYEQYITIFLALNDIFKAPIQRYSSGEFCTKAEQASRDNPANRNPLRKEFQLLLKVKQPKTDADYKLVRQKSAGRTTDKVLPLDKYSLHLSSTIPKQGNYINAITVPSFSKARRFIVTQYPTPEDAVDFLRLLSDYESDTVICLDPVHDVQSIQSWLPQLSSSKVVAPFTIHCQSNCRNGIPGHVIHILQDKQADEAHSVLVVEPRKKITPHSNPLDTSELLRLVSNVLYSETETPVTVVSSDGASLCGVFIAVHNVIQQLNMDGGVDVFTAVRQLQIRRPEFCGSFEEYEMIYKAVLDHIQTTSENIYSNQ